jgi:hypothetical protein
MASLYVVLVKERKIKPKDIKKKIIKRKPFVLQISGVLFALAC